jgi:hypothetical protein
VISYFSYQKGDRWYTKATVISVAFLNACFTAYLWCESSFVAPGWRQLTIL